MVSGNEPDYTTVIRYTQTVYLFTPRKKDREKIGSHRRIYDFIVVNSGDQRRKDALMTKGRFPRSRPICHPQSIYV